MSFKTRMLQICVAFIAIAGLASVSWAGGATVDTASDQMAAELARLKAQNQALMDRLQALESKMGTIAQEAEEGAYTRIEDKLAAERAKHIALSVHGSLVNVIGTTDNGDHFLTQISSAKTDYFSYKNAANPNGALSEDATGALYKNKANESHQFGITKARLRFQIDTPDNLARFVYGIEVGAADWGNNSSMDLSGDGTNLETRFVYGQFKVPGMENNFVRVGLQPTKINTWVWTETAPGITWHGKTDLMKYMLGWYRAGDDGDDNGLVWDADGYNDYFVAKLDGKVTEGVNLGIFGIYVDQSNEITNPGDIYDAQYYYVGLTGKVDMAGFFGLFDAIYQGGDIDFENDAIDDLDRSAYFLHATLGYNFTEQAKAYFTFAYTSGDDDPNDDNADNFDAIDTDVPVGIIFFKDSYLSDADRYYSDGAYVLDKGFIHYGLTGEYQIDDKNHVRAAVRYMETAEDIELGGEKESELGTELDFWYTYKYNKYLDLRLEAAYLFAGDATEKYLGGAFATNDNDDEVDDFYYIGAGMKFKF